MESRLRFGGYAFEVYDWKWRLQFPVGATMIGSSVGLMGRRTIIGRATVIHVQVSAIDD